MSFIKRWFWRWCLYFRARPVEFDAEWYRQRYIDVAEADIEPLMHFLCFGEKELRDPSPNISVSGQFYFSAGSSSLPELSGDQVWREGCPVMMVCAHQVGQQLFGAERSLLDVLDALNQLALNILVTLPGAINKEYADQVRTRAWRLAILPYGWWRMGQLPVAATVRHFRDLMRRYNVAILYANTLVLNEPLVAAQELSIPRCMHVRELPDFDPALCSLLNATPEEIRQRVKVSADIVLSNSVFTAQVLGFDNTIIVPNSIRMEDFDSITTPAERGELLAVGMISSNLPKKGLDDFVAMAHMLGSCAPNIRCYLVGPCNVYTQQLRKQQSRGDIPANILFSGYVSNAQEALLNLDVVVNLSHFQESFGRTVLEAMAAGRPVVAYEWGALPELVEDGVTGYLLPLGDVEGVVRKVCLLADDMGLRQRLGQAARERAARHFSPKRTKAALQNILLLCSRI